MNTMFKFRFLLLILSGGRMKVPFEFVVFLREQYHTHAKEKEQSR